MKLARALIKIPAARAAWRNVCAENGEDPSDRALELFMAVGDHETGGGDAWPGPDGLLDTADDEHNVGATTLQSLNAAEKAVLTTAGIVPTVGAGHNERARQAMFALKASGLTLPQGVIHCDSRTVIGKDGKKQLVPYFVWFASFPTEVEGWSYFLKLLCIGRGGKKKYAYSVLMRANATPYDLAAAMYAAGYFWGFHPHDAEGDEKNIEAYADAISRSIPSIRAAIKYESEHHATDPAPPSAGDDEELTPVQVPHGSLPASVLTSLDDARREAVADARAEALGHPKPYVAEEDASDAAPPRRPSGEIPAATIMRGMKNEVVRQMQAKLNLEPRPAVWPWPTGWPLKEDADFGEKSEYTLKAYQARRGLPVTGELDYTSRVALGI